MMAERTAWMVFWMEGLSGGEEVRIR